MIKQALIITLTLSFQLNAFAKTVSVFTGSWKGQCSVKLAGPDAKVVELEMSLEVTPVNSNKVLWKIQYQGESARNYEMLIKDKENGHWVLDEKTGIFINRFWEAETQELVDLYSINGKIFTTKTTVKKNKMTIRALSFWANGGRTSGVKNTDVQVHSFILRNKHVCELKKVLK